MGNYDDYIESLTKMRRTLESNAAFQQGLGLPPNIDKNAKIGLDMVNTEMLLHIADDLKRIADSLEKLTIPLSFYEEDKGARKENKENGTK